MFLYLGCFYYNKLVRFCVDIMNENLFDIFIIVNKNCRKDGLNYFYFRLSLDLFSIVYGM